VIVDSHVHLKPGRLAQAIRSFFEQHIGDRIVYPIDHRTVLDALGEDGVGAVWNLPYAHRRGVAAPLNADMIAISESLADHPVVVVPGCTVHPDDVDPEVDFHTAVDAGARVLKLHCSVGGYEPDDARLSAVLEAAGRRGVPVVVHAGHDISGMTGSHELGAVGRAAAAHRSTTLILAHFGHDAAVEAVPLLDAHPNLFADLTPVLDSPVVLEPGTIERFADRLLLGSDAPNTGCHVASLIARVRAEGLSPSQEAAVLGGNALRLVPLPHPPPVRRVGR